MEKEKLIKDKIVKKTYSLFPGSEIYLFGSKARGDSKDFSDWDILILLKLSNISFEIETKLMDDLYDIELETGEIISPLIYSKKEWDEKYSYSPLYINIKKEGIRLI